ncbi:UNKNOWN [Stylonychia lemnae]|uniref:Uncharacterized protein n=1 Tax=Stylonychia lemnae TaxID=5949 RepID=A0A077ZNL4_STYLE|nr:UNKNOWN [Stylonychia lemnae]|eukprot:CDW71508.1 UNKNOWN [Stylonychia lemnae]
MKYHYPLLIIVLASTQLIFTQGQSQDESLRKLQSVDYEYEGTGTVSGQDYNFKVQGTATLQDEKVSAAVSDEKEKWVRIVVGMTLCFTAFLTILTICCIWAFKKRIIVYNKERNAEAALKNVNINIHHINQPNVDEVQYGVPQNNSANYPIVIGDSRSQQYKVVDQQNQKYPGFNFNVNEFENAV